MTGEPLLDAAQLAERLGVSKRWVYAQVEAHELPAYKVGKRLAFELGAVQRWLDARRIGDWSGSCADPGQPAEIPSMMQEAQVG